MIATHQMKRIQFITFIFLFLFFFSSLPEMSNLSNEWKKMQTKNGRRQAVAAKERKKMQMKNGRRQVVTAEERKNQNPVNASGKKSPSKLHYSKFLVKFSYSKTTRHTTGIDVPFN